MDGFEKVFLKSDRNRIKIRYSDLSWSVLILAKKILFDAICDLLLDPKNLYYYASNKSFSMTMNDIKNHINSLADDSIISNDLNSIFVNIGWLPIEQLDIDNTVLQGDLGELLMCILMDKLEISKTLISNVCFKTAPKSSAHGTDNVFFDSNNKILYFGESKFHKTLEDCLNSAITSLKSHASDSFEISFIQTHTNDFIAEDGTTRQSIQQSLETFAPGSYKISSIIFAMEEDLFLKKDVENEVFRHRTFDSSETPFSDCIIVVLPIISKDEFLEHFLMRVSKYE